MKLIGGREVSLEARLTQFFVISIAVWSAFNTISSFITRLPMAITLMYVANLVWVIFVMAIGFATHKEKVFKYIYLTSFLFIIPVMWYFLGGTEGAANVLFVCLYVAYIMCLSGKKRNVYLLISLFLTPMCSRVGMMITRPEWLVLEGRQKGVCSSLLGLSTSIVISALLMKQKNEFVKERDAAIESEKNLEKSNKLQKNFLANMSHEIRSPLGIVLGFNNLISESKDVDQIHEYAKNIDNAGKTLRTVINDILDYSKIESGKLDIINEDYSFKEMIGEIKTNIKLKAEEKGLKFSVKVDENIPDVLNGDCVRVRQCLLNVLSNAVKYTDSGEVIFEACKDIADETKCRIKFVVSDTGRGMSKESLTKLFDAFQRLDEGQNRSIEGTGLGMAITKSLLDEMGGSISVESEKGVGSTFTILIEQSLILANNIISESVVEEFDYSGRKALVVDDTKMNLVLISKFLGKLGMESTTVDNGKTALELAANDKYDIIFLDHMMPEMNGIEVFIRLREMAGVNTETPVIMLTANAMAGISQEYMDMGFDGYVSKPIDMNKLKSEIAKVLI